jgi:hypothetical protein
VDFGVVKVGEICPGADQGTTAPTPAGAVMPNLIGKSGKVVDETLPNASLTFNDGSGQGRAVIIASNWQVCATSPKPGEAYGGVPVTVTVVKYGESCG